jgi:apolipoprotein N-acyltransferase
MNTLRKLLPPIASGLLLHLAFLPTQFRLVAFLALIPWFVALPSLGTKGAFKSGYVMGLVFFAGQFQFLDTLTQRWTGSAYLAAIPWALCTLVASLYFAFAGFLSRLCFGLRVAWAIPLVWAGIEVLRSYCPVLAFPYGLLAHALWPYPVLIQDAYLGSVYLVSAMIVAISLAFAQTWRTRQLAWPPSIFGLVLLMASVALYFRPVSGVPFRVAVGQPGIDQAFGKNKYEDVTLIMDHLARQGLGDGARLLILPEGIADLGDLPVHYGVPLLYGVQRHERGVYQSAQTIEDGRVQYADKTRLVIFGEFVPGRSWIPGLSSFKLPSGDLDAGTEVKALNVAGTRVGPIICFEELFPDLTFRQGLNHAQFIAVVSDDDWFMGTGMPEQLKGACVFRAVESNLPLVRSGSLGYSLVLSPLGDIERQANLGDQTVLTSDLKLNNTIAPFWQPAFPLASLATICWLTAVHFWLRGRKSKAKQ